jgi:hypothetical protein
MSSLSKRLTTSNFLVEDIFSALEQKMVSKSYETICYLVAELVMSGKTKLLVTFLISAFAQRYLSINVAFIEAILRKLSRIERLRFASNNDGVRRAACEVAVLIAQQGTSSISFQRYLSSSSSTATTIRFPNLPNAKHVLYPDSIDLLPPTARMHVERIAALMTWFVNHSCNASAEARISQDNFPNLFKITIHTLNQLFSSSTGKAYDQCMEALWDVSLMPLMMTPAQSDGKHATQRNARNFDLEMQKRYVASLRGLYYVAPPKNRRERDSRLNLWLVAMYMTLKHIQPVCIEVETCQFRSALRNVSVVYDDIKSTSTDQGIGHPHTKRSDREMTTWHTSQQPPSQPPPQIVRDADTGNSRMIIQRASSAAKDSDHAYHDDHIAPGSIMPETDELIVPQHSQRHDRRQSSKAPRVKAKATHPPLGHEVLERLKYLQYFTTTTTGPDNESYRGDSAMNNLDPLAPLVPPTSNAAVIRTIDVGLHNCIGNTLAGRGGRRPSEPLEERRPNGRKHVVDNVDVWDISRVSQTC